MRSQTGHESLARLWREARTRRPSSAAATVVDARALPRAESPSDLEGSAAAILGLAAGGDPAVPAMVRAALPRYADWIAAGRAPRAAEALDYGDVAVEPDDIATTLVRAHERLADIVAVGAVPLVLGGGSVVTVPVLQVLTGKLRGRLGVIAFSPTYDVALQPVHGSASRWARALELGIVVPDNLTLIGGRAEPGDAQALRVLDGLGAHTFSVHDVAALGVAAVAQEALELAARGTEAVYVSVDLEVMEAAAEPIGLTARELVEAVVAVGSAHLAAADVCGASVAPGAASSVVVAARVVAELALAVIRQRS